MNSPTNFPTLPKTEKTFITPFWPRPIKYRAFTMGQQSILLQTAERETPLKDKLASLSNVFNQSVESGVPFEKLPICLVEKVFLLMRELAIGEVMKVSYKCTHEISEADAKQAGHEPGPCNQPVVLNIKLDEFILKNEEGFTDVIPLVNGFHLKLRLPCVEDAQHLDNPNIESSDLLSIFAVSLSDADGNVWEITDENRAEFSAWCKENIEISKFDEITDNFFQKLPHIYYHKDVPCPKCKKVHPIEFRGLSDVFI